MEPYYISFIMASNCCESCAIKELPEKTDFRNQSLEYLKDAIYEIRTEMEYVCDDSGAVDKKKEIQLIQLNNMSGSAIAKCYNCDGKLQRMKKYLRENLIITDIDAESQKGDEKQTIDFPPFQTERGRLN